jgi:AmmeMemoRadiSam system protein B
MTQTRPNGLVRPPAVAGLFYPGDPDELLASVDKLLASAARLRGGGRVRAIIAPHAGYIYSGPIAAEAFAALRPEQASIQRAVIIGPAHQSWTPGIAAPKASAFATPLGELPVDAAAIDLIANLSAVAIDDRPHAQEHSLEVELPFLQRTVGTLPIVPLVVGGAAPNAVAEVLETLWDDGTVIIVSSDLSHYLPYQAAQRRDLETARAIEALDDASLEPEAACGAVPVRALLMLAKRRGLSVQRLDLRSSGDTAGDRNAVVGYGAWVVRDEAPAR